MTFGSLFAGIGGIDLGLERAGMRCVWQVEIDEYARRVLAKHWPDVRRHDDVRTFPPTNPEEWRCDLVAGGFPCQDISNAGKRAGIAGERSGLWSEYARIIRVVRPRIILVENVAALLYRGIGDILGDLAACGYDAEWDCIPAAVVGSPHWRDRVFILAYRHGEHGRARREGGFAGVAEGLQVPSPTIPHSRQGPIAGHGWWSTEPQLDRLVHGIPAAVDRLRGLGNAVVPQIAEWIGKCILAQEGQ